MLEIRINKNQNDLLYYYDDFQPGAGVGYSHFAAMNRSLTIKSSSESVQAVADKLENILRSKNIRVFARIDHAEAAKAQGLELQDEQVLIFGDPKVGTSLMQECPSVGIELPLKMVIWRGEQTFIGYRDPRLLLEEYEIVVHRGIVEKMSMLMANLVAELIK